VNRTRAIAAALVSLVLAVAGLGADRSGLPSLDRAALAILSAPDIALAAPERAAVARALAETRGDDPDDAALPAPAAAAVAAERDLWRTPRHAMAAPDRAVATRARGPPGQPT
jgi:hypothetical protein